MLRALSSTTTRINLQQPAVRQLLLRARSSALLFEGAQTNSGESVSKLSPCQSRPLSTLSKLEQVQKQEWQRSFSSIASSFGNSSQDDRTQESQSVQPNKDDNNNNNHDSNKAQRVYSWIDAEAESLIAKAYERHLYKQDENTTHPESYPPSLQPQDLEKIGEPQHYVPQDWVDKLAYSMMRFLRKFTHAFFREKYDHHAVTLETVAAVPGIVGAFHRHLRSLRRMERDNSWIGHLLEEAQNERMHLLIFLKVTNPSRLERAIVVLAQFAYLSFYSALYMLSGRAAHRLVGYLEEEAHYAYTDYLKALDDGRLPMKPAPEIARQYYRLPEDATIRDVVLHIRADESYHRDTNHYLSNLYREGGIDRKPVMMSKDAVEMEEQQKQRMEDSA